MATTLNSPNHGIKLEQYMLHSANCHLKLDSKHEAANAARYYKKSNIKGL
ncbi:hypothetical protein KY290_027794 [Solanum tuberosum]|uniref:Uncharacterized protein n=1 Tax=Solanum tuberosum TaxID=4113 RepID=A0ABQ7UG58_SOLTU|nr:hypothetical protein KY289_026984 [Solanum tuberosum]KAH0661878.1 hypothetical protein KY284_026809 [Solanum tuberosum]KAH0665571.1 hypothetical protein KY285_026777 [Solanum tuberosum]KAH0748562.1 hypothetical protein KY290_027794 [Solanum tuberosum]